MESLYYIDIASNRAQTQQSEPVRVEEQQLSDRVIDSARQARVQARNRAQRAERADSIARADSLVNAQIEYQAQQEAIAAAEKQELIARNTIRLVTDYKNYRSEYRTTNNPADIFGAAATTEQRLPPPTKQAVSFTDNGFFQGFVLLLAITYAILIYRHIGDVMLLLSRLTRSLSAQERMTDDQSSTGYSRFLNLTIAIGILFIGVIVVKSGGSFVPRELYNALPQIAVLIFGVGVAVVALAIMLYQLLLLRLVGVVTLSQEFISQLLYLKRTYFSLMVVFVSPALILFSLCPDGRGQGWFFVIAAGLVMTMILYLNKTLGLFISKKISILHWFLYLCIVDIFPVSLLVLAAVR